MARNPPPPARTMPSLLTRSTPSALAPALVMVLALACAPDGPRTTLGPADGRELPAVDTGRVAVGDAAPDFALESYDDGVVRLSSYLGSKDVVLVFYRGHW